jgi:uncharacterized protein
MDTIKNHPPASIIGLMIFELPLFPLNTVLFPGMPLQLHIFEERYKEMINKCLDEKQPFGVVLIRSGREALGPLAEPHEIGCTARILEVEKLSEGRLNISVLGQRRFRLLSVNHDLPYLKGYAELYPLDNPNPQSLTSSSRQLMPWVKRYMRILAEVSDLSLDPKQLPTDPLVLAYLAAVLVQTPAAEKQGLLASEHAIDLLTNLRAIYRREVALMQALFSGQNQGKRESFSLN